MSTIEYDPRMEKTKELRERRRGRQGEREKEKEREKQRERKKKIFEEKNRNKFEIKGRKATTTEYHTLNSDYLLSYRLSLISIATDKKKQKQNKNN